MNSPEDRTLLAHLHLSVYLASPTIANRQELEALLDQAKSGNRAKLNALLKEDIDQCDDDDESVDECDACASTDVSYPYTTLGYLCTRCRSAYHGRFSNVK